MCMRELIDNLQTTEVSGPFNPCTTVVFCVLSFPFVLLLFAGNTHIEGPQHQGVVAEQLASHRGWAQLT